MTSNDVIAIDDRPWPRANGSVQARWVVPMDGRVLSPGVIRFETGRILAVEEGTDPDAHDLGDCVVLPGLINAHTHLEFSDLRQPFPAGESFPHWIRNVIAHRRNRGRVSAEVIGEALRETRSSGTVALGEIATDDLAADVLQREAARGIVFRELLGLSDEAVETGLATARSFLDDRRWPASPGLFPGLSPHAPYSVAPRLLDGLINLAVERQVPVAMHLAETDDERLLLQEGRGPFVTLLQDLGLWRPDLIPRSGDWMPYLKSLSKAPRALVVHGNFLAATDIDFLAGQPQMSVVYCPRTHHHFGHPPHPWKALLERGIRVVLGTDSRASNPDLNLFRELQWLANRDRDIPAEALLRMATIDAAAALGLSDRLGTIAPGRAVELAVLSMPGGLKEFTWEALLSEAVEIQPFPLAERP